ncbi:MAG: heme exporter protein CcmD [Cellvibrionaceae bacterium]
MDFQFESFAAFMNMDGHGPYVWASYIITTVSLKLLVVIPYWYKKSLTEQIKRQQRIEENSIQENCF